MKEKERVEVTGKKFPIVMPGQAGPAKVGDVIPFLEKPGGKPIGKATVVENTPERVLVDIVLDEDFILDDVATFPYTSAEIRTSRRRRKKGRR